MGAIAVSKKEEQQIEWLRKDLRIPTKAGVLRLALRTLESQLRRSGYDKRSMNLSGVARLPTNENTVNSLRLPWATGSRKHRCKSSVDMCMWLTSTHGCEPNRESCVLP